MTTNVFPVRLRAAAIVKRWSIVWTLQPDTIAQHMYFNALYSRTVADLIEWKGDRGLLALVSLLHDVEETVTGDIVGVVKHEIIDAKKASDFTARVMERQMPTIHDAYMAAKADPSYDEMHKIVKVADHLDSAFYALTEQALGNRIIGARIHLIIKRLEEAWYRLPGDHFLLGKIWEEQIHPALEAHEDSKNYDIDMRPGR